MSIGLVNIINTISRGFGRETYSDFRLTQVFPYGAGTTDMQVGRVRSGRDWRGRKYEEFSVDRTLTGKIPEEVGVVRDFSGILSHVEHTLHNAVAILEGRPSQTRRERRTVTIDHAKAAAQIVANRTDRAVKVHDMFAKNDQKPHVVTPNSLRVSR